MLVSLFAFNTGTRGCVACCAGFLKKMSLAPVALYLGVRSANDQESKIENDAMICLTTNEVVGFLNGHLSEQQIEAVEQHLDDCPACRFLVVELARSESVDPPADAGPADAGAVDAGAVDAGAVDAGAVDAGAVTSLSNPIENLAGARTDDEVIKEVSFSGKMRPRVAVVEGSRRSRKRVPIEAEGRYQIKSEYRRGGQARILVAYDTFMGREVAFKEIIKEAPRGRAPFTPKEKALMGRRFLREARIAGRLTHPSIVHVYETGRRADGTLYYTMPLVGGKTLAEELDSCDGLAERLKQLGHFLNLCQGIAYAHSQGVLHRDIKPENVLIGEFGETVLLDWGLAKTAMLPTAEDVGRDHFEEEEALTELGMSLGTPAYMSPEQAAGELDKVDERSDIWGLGAVLYMLLTGEPPYQGKSAADIVSKVLTAQLVPVRRRCPEVPAELAAMAEKALCRDQELRHQTAMELADEVSAYLIGRQVRAGGLEGRGRSRGATLATGFTVFGLVAALVYVGVSHHRLGRKMDLERAVLAGERRTTAQLLRRIESQRRRPRPSPDLLLPGKVVAFARSADRRWVASADAERNVSVWRVVDGWRTLQLRAGESRIHGVALSPDGARLAVASRDGVIRVWDVRTGKLIHTMRGHMGAALAVSFAADGRTLASGGVDRTVVLWDVVRGAEVGRLKGHADRVTAVVFCPRGGRLASAAQDGTVSVWTRASGVLQRTLSGHGRRIDELACSEDGRQVGAATWRHSARIWDLKDGASLLLFGATGRAQTKGQPRAGAGAKGSKGRVRGRTRLLTQRDSGVHVDLQLLLWAARRTREGRPRRIGGPKRQP
jgi:eukaryotic-like serine/threonine-protein kinase